MVNADWLRIGAVSTGGRGRVTSADSTYFAKYLVGYIGFEIEDYRIANFHGEDRKPTTIDITMLARWLIGVDFAELQAQLPPMS